MYLYVLPMLALVSVLLPHVKALHVPIKCYQCEAAYERCNDPFTSVIQECEDAACGKVKTSFHGEYALFCAIKNSRLSFR